MTTAKTTIEDDPVECEHVLALVKVLADGLYATRCVKCERVVLTNYYYGEPQEEHVTHRSRSQVP